MTIYGEFDDRFRDGPSKYLMAIVSAASLILAAPVATLLIALIETALIRAAGWKLFWIAEPLLPRRGVAALFHDSILVSSWLQSSNEMIAVASIAVSLILVGYYPVSDRLGSRIVLQAIAQSFAAIGAVAPSIERLSRYSVLPVSELVIASVLLAAGVAAIGVSEVHLFQDLAQFRTMTSTAQRFLWWSAHVPAGALGVAIVSAAVFSQRGMIAAAAIAATTLVVVLFRTPRANAERIDHRLRVAPLLTVILAVAAAGATIWGAARTPPLVLADGSGIRLAERSYVEQALKSELERKVEAERPEPRIRIRWSRDRAK